MGSGKKIKSFGVLIVFITGCFFIGWLGGMATASSRTSWYAALHKPYLNPPDGVFAPVWSVLYLLMAIAGWRIWGVQGRDSKKMKVLFFGQLTLNGLWSFLFFGLRNPLMGLADIFLLCVLLALLVSTSSKRERVAGYLLTPYLLWVCFAAYLNAGIWWLNLHRS